MGDDCKPVSLGINGFGLIGQSVLFSSFTDSLVNVTAINDASMSIDYIVYVVRHESPLSKEDRASVMVVGEYICFQGMQKIRFTQKHDLLEIGWRDAGVTYVVECSGLNSTRERCWGHITAGAQGVIIAGQSADAPTIIVGANETEVKKTYPVVCAGVPIAVALSPLIRLLHESYGIEECSYTAIHGMRPLDPILGRSGNARDWRQSRMTIDSIVPHNNNGERTITKVMPGLSDRISGSAIQVPVVNGCAVDMLVRLAHPAPKEAFDDLVKEAAVGCRFKGVLEYSNEELSSRDCIPNGKLYYDAPSSRSLRDGEAHKLLLWFDFEKSYAKRLLSLAVHLQQTGAMEGM